MLTGLTKKGRKFRYIKEVPKGWKELKNATTAPIGFSWFWNSKSLFSKEYEAILVKNKDE